ncbi:hypothetical protein BD779DRAFT_1523828 [Infundibulicybe gibba]|nr:hypothetical protein BD779DRAFT_1523828 [Infundibulicybe gibba]
MIPLFMVRPIFFLVTRYFYPFLANGALTTYSKVTEEDHGSDDPGQTYGIFRTVTGAGLMASFLCFVNYTWTIFITAFTRREYLNFICISNQTLDSAKTPYRTKAIAISHQPELTWPTYKPLRTWSSFATFIILVLTAYPSRLLVIGGAR